MNEITMLELRRQTRRVLERLRKGERLLLTHRGNPIATLEPVREGRPASLEGDALFRLDEFAVDGPGGSLDNEAIDRAVYGA